VTSIGGQVSWSTFSDGRFKKDVKENVAGLEFIKKLRPVSYIIDAEKLNEFRGITEDKTSLKSASQASSEKHTGFIAQEVDQLVKTNGYEFNGVDVPQNDKDNYAIRYADFVVPLVKAVQELSATITSQQEEINQLKATIAESKLNIQSSNGIQLMQNFPNPFTTDTKIEMFLPDEIVQAEIQIFSMEGETVKIIPVNARGNTSVNINGGTLKSGVYVYALIANGEIAGSRRMVLTK
jgi:hypothetical protein